eukprot:1590982-Amphidinium_carterae.1
MSSKEDVHDCICQDYYEGIHATPSALSNAYDQPENTGGLLDKLTVAPGARVMLRVNLDVQD